MTWPSTNAPATAPATHGPVRTQAYYAGGGDYFRSGYYSHGLFVSAATSTQTMTAGVLHLRAFVVPVRRTFDRIGLNVTTGAGAGGVLRFGIYASPAGVPATLISDFGTVGSTATGPAEITISQTLDPGVYFLAAAAQVANCSVTAYPTTTSVPWIGTATTPPAATTGGLAFTQASVTGALPNPPAAPANYLFAAPATSLRAA